MKGMADQGIYFAPGPKTPTFFERTGGPVTVRQTLQQRETFYFRVAGVAAAVSAYGFIEDKRWAKWAGVLGGLVAGWNWWRARQDVDALSAQEQRALAAELARNEATANPKPDPNHPLNINGMDGGTSLPGEPGMNGLDS